MEMVAALALAGVVVVGIMYLNKSRELRMTQAVLVGLLKEIEKLTEQMENGGIGQADNGDVLQASDTTH